MTPGGMKPRDHDSRLLFFFFWFFSIFVVKPGVLFVYTVSMVFGSNVYIYISLGIV